MKYVWLVDGWYVVEEGYLRGNREASRGVVSPSMPMSYVWSGVMDRGAISGTVWAVGPPNAFGLKIG